LVFTPSVYVHTTVVEAVIGRLALWVPVTVPKQLSVAVGAVRLVTLHCALMTGSEAKSATGAVVSAIVMVWFCVVVFKPSVYVQTTVVDAVIGRLAL
ncbi:hypothetical protein, partial [Pseudomonas sp. Xaverov 259]|uniref:hypothetical protein n=1 Tax=Pseudomonas sp. Xaverov 259 TaxID=2666086 RepID=UPI001C5CB1A2